ncbi:Disease resistance protein [Vitis vinifera]|uniref:Disease resistance protein n=1 Tax=Vitis vinifera TaxID=29760 RepID=A0A438C1W2_VITVI|nr:Disease resistance protein [Vitis vinifera]
MVEIVISVAAKVADLHLARERLQVPVDEANRQGDEIFPGVQEWQTYAEGIIQKRNDFNEDERKASKSCFYLKSRYQLSKQAEKQAAEIVDKIQEAHNFGDRVSYRPPPPPPPFISSASFKDYGAFQSRESTFNQIMEALRNEDMRMIGVWGMGGVGKTTLVKQVAQQAEEDKLFHKVVMVLHISQTPNIAENSRKIARMLGLKFEVKEDRAGIPYRDDHKGCKVLLTSGASGLSKDMRTQKEFHLQHLSEDEAWNLFKKTAGESVHVWENALEELRRSAPTNIRGVSKDVYSCLELSYNHLESDESNERFSSLFFNDAFVRMHDVVRDVAISIASKEPHQFVVKEAVGLQEEWQWMNECRNCTRISLKCKNIDELPQGLMRARRHSSNWTPGETTILSLACSHIYQLPKEMMKLSDLRVLDLRYCFSLKVIPQNLIFSLSRLEYLSMKGSVNIEWEAEGFNSGERINACLSELKHLSGLRTLELEVSNPSDSWRPYDEEKPIARLPNDYEYKAREDEDVFPQVKYLCIWSCPTMQYILHSTSVEWVHHVIPSVCWRNCFLTSLSNLEAVMPWPNSDGVFWESAFPQLQHLELSDLPELISFYSIRSSGIQDR